MSNQETKPVDPASQGGAAEAKPEGAGAGTGTDGGQATGTGEGGGGEATPRNDGAQAGAGETPAPDTDAAAAALAAAATGAEPEPAPDVKQQQPNSGKSGKVAGPTAEQIAAANKIKGQTPQPKAAPAAPAASKEEESAKSGPTNIAEVDKILRGVPSEFHTPILAIKQYMTDMAPRRPIDAVEGGRHQVTLYRAIQAIINIDTEHFNALFQALLKLMLVHKDGVFHETYVFRYTEQMLLTAEDRRGFAKLLTLFITLADPKSRQQQLPQIAWGEVLRYGLTEGGRQRILAFFEV